MKKNVLKSCGLIACTVLGLVMMSSYAPDCFPYRYSEWPVLFPDTEDCSKFYKCDKGEAIQMSCPKGLHFNDKFKTCDYPELANCLGEDDEECSGGTKVSSKCECTWEEKEYLHADTGLDLVMTFTFKSTDCAGSGGICCSWEYRLLSTTSNWGSCVHGIY
jgi:hypothetical protein